MIYKLMGGPMDGLLVQIPVNSHEYVFRTYHRDENLIEEHKYSLCDGQFKYSHWQRKPYFVSRSE